MKPNKLIAMISIVFAVITIILTFGFDNSIFGDDFSGPGFFPKICASGMILLAIILLFQNRHEKSIKNINFKFLSVPLIGLIALIIYTLLLKAIGFPLDTFILCVFLLKLFGVRRNIPIALFSAITAWGVNFIFNDLLAVSLPEGLLPPSFQIIAAAIIILYIIVLLIKNFINRGKKND